MQKFEILIASPPDREKLVAEIWFHNDLIAEENEHLKIEIYSIKKNRFQFNEFIDVLENAKNRLMQS